MGEIVKAVIYGIVEGITEWLPISSTGHMILLEKWLAFSPDAVSESFMDMFLVVVQLGAIAAVVVMYWNRLFPFTGKKGGYIRKDIWSMWFKVAAACVPAVIVELLWGDKIEDLFYRYEIVAVMLILVGICFIFTEKHAHCVKVHTIAGIHMRTAFMIGIFQAVAAVFPGTSRSGATILGALILGVARETAAEFTFFMAVPVMAGAGFMKLVQFGMCFGRQEAAILLVGMAAAFAVSVCVIGSLMKYIRRHDFTVFGYYRIILGILVLILYPLF